MNTFRSEIYTLRHLGSVQLVAALTLVAAAVGATLQWMLPFLLRIDPPEQYGGEVGKQVDALLAKTDASAAPFQMAALDLTGSGQSSGISTFAIALVALIVTMAVVQFSSGAVVWKVVNQGNRLGWATSLLAAIISGVLAICVALCIVVALIAGIAILMHDTTFAVPLVDLAGLWLRGILAIVLFSAFIAGIVLAVRRSGPAIGIVVGIVIIGVIVGTVGSMTGLNPGWYMWFPTNAFTLAGGQGLVQPWNPWVGILILGLWSALTIGFGMSRFQRTNL